MTSSPLSHPAAHSPRTVLILGARGRLGLAAARAFAQAGWQVLAQVRPASHGAAGTGGMALQAPHFAYSVDERAFLSEPAFYKGKSRLKVGLIPEIIFQKTVPYFCVRP